MNYELQAKSKQPDEYESMAKIKKKHEKFKIAPKKKTNKVKMIISKIPLKCECKVIQI